MAQFARPDSDVTAGLWVPIGGPATLFDTMNEVVANDTDFAESDSNPTLDLMEVGLSNLNDPVLSTGHILRYRYQKDSAAGAQIDLVVDLVQGVTVIATFTHLDIQPGFITQAQALTGPQTDAITDYTDLRIRFTADNPGPGATREAHVSFAEFEIPLQLSGTITSVTTFMGTLEATVPLVGSASGQSVLSGVMFAFVPLAGGALGISALSGSLNIPRVLQGPIVGQSILTGALPVVKSLVSIIPGVSVLQGRILLDEEIGGLIAATSNLSGTMIATVRLSGTIDAVGALQSLLTRIFGILGISNTFATLDGMLSVAFMISGLVEAQAINDARLRINDEQITTGVGGKVNPLITVGGKVANNGQ